MGGGGGGRGGFLGRTTFAKPSAMLLPRIAFAPYAVKR